MKLHIKLSVAILSGLIVIIAIAQIIQYVGTVICHHLVIQL